MNTRLSINSNLDLSFTRLVPVKRGLFWRAWTEPELLVKWFCPLPWQTTQCEIDLYPGGKFETTMQSPEGQRISNIGCYLEIDPQKKLIWTNAFSPGFRPKSQINKTIQSGPNFEFTAIIELTDSGNQTRYTATVMHSDHESC